MEYVNVIKKAIIFFPIIAALISLPFLIYHYRKYGTISFYRFVLIYSFFFYLLCCYFLVILPLPKRSLVANLTTPYYNIKPFYFIPDFITSDSFNIINPNTYLLIFKKFEYLEPIFNVLMVIPFGVYLRYYFKCSFTKTIIYSFMLSLFFEITQLTGLYFIYPRPYRLCDVNDLINNTSGGIIGYLITPLFGLFLPKREKIDSEDYKKGQFVSILRNAISIAIDYLIILIFTFILEYFIREKNYKILYLTINFITFTIIPTISRGYTFGKWILNSRYTNKSIDPSIPLYKYILKWIILHIFIINGWLIILILKTKGITIPRYIWYTYLGIIFTFMVYCLNCLIIHKDIFINKILGITSISTIGIDDEDEI